MNSIFRTCMYSVHAIGRIYFPEILYAWPSLAMVQLNAEEEKRRFQIELEFLNCLANPWYLNNLAQQQYFKDPAFIRYLEYLQYWKQPEYAKFVVYPHSLYFLDLLQHEQFREHISTSENTQETHRMQYYHWMYLRNGPEGQVKQTEETVTNTTAPEPTADSTAVAALDSLPPA